MHYKKRKHDNCTNSMYFEYKGNILELPHIQLVIVNFHRTEKYKVSNIKNII